MNSSAGPCDAGYYCVSGVNISNPTVETTSGIGGPCPAGFFCPQGTHTPSPCPNGTYSDKEYNEEEADCDACDLGHFCGSYNLTAPEGECHGGFYCLLGASYPNPTGKSTILNFIAYFENGHDVITHLYVHASASTGPFCTCLCIFLLTDNNAHVSVLLHKISSDVTLILKVGSKLIAYCLQHSCLVGGGSTENLDKAISYHIDMSTLNLISNLR